MKTKGINIKYLAQYLEHGIIQRGSSCPPYIQMQIYHIYKYIKSVEFYIQSAHRFNYKYVAYVICSINVIQIVLLEM